MLLELGQSAYLLGMGMSTFALILFASIIGGTAMGQKQVEVVASAAMVLLIGGFLYLLIPLLLIAVT